MVDHPVSDLGSLNCFCLSAEGKQLEARIAVLLNKDIECSLVYDARWKADLLV